MTNHETSLRSVVVAGVGMTAFGKFLDRSIKLLVAEIGSGCHQRLGDGATRTRASRRSTTRTPRPGFWQGQHSVRGQHAMREAGSTAFR